MDASGFAEFTVAALESRVGNDRALAAEIARVFLQVRADLGARLRKAVDAADAERVVDAAHELKGMSATIGAERLAAAAKEIEFAARARDVAVFADPQRLLGLDAEWSRVSATLAALAGEAS